MNRSIVILLVLASSGCTALDLWDPPVVRVEARSCTALADCEGLRFQIPDALAREACIVPKIVCDSAHSQCTVELRARDSDNDRFRDHDCAGKVENFAPTAVDCIDGDAAAFPGADVDRDGYIHAGCDDGSGKPADCDDTRYTVHDGAEEACDGVVSACVGTTAPAIRLGEDDDGDHHSPTGTMICSNVFDTTGTLRSYPTDDCDDTDQFVYSGAPDVCDGRENDCDIGVGPDLEEDHDGDGFAPISSASNACNAGLEGSFPTTDCDDLDVHTFPGAPEFCDSIVNDCAARMGGSIARPSEDPDSDGFYAGDAACVGAIVAIECNGSATDATTRQCPPRVETTIRSAASPSYAQIVTGDFDDDGFAELIGLEFARDKLDLFGSAAGVWSPGAPVVWPPAAPASNFVQLAVARTDVAGPLVLVVSHVTGSITTLPITHPAAYVFGTEVAVAGTTTASGAFGVGDVDGDGHADVVFATSTGGIDWAEIDPLGTSSGTVDAGAPAVVADKILVADVDGDGDGDVLVMTKTSSSLALYASNAGASFAAPTAIGPTGAGASLDAVAGDFEGDGDGDIDLIVAGATGTTLFARQASGTYVNISLTALPLFSGMNPPPFASGDLDRDGRDELLYVDYSADTVGYVDELGSSIFPTHAIVSDYDGARLVTPGDVDGDGDLDVVGYGTPPSTSVLSFWRSDFASNTTFAPHNVDRAFSGVSQVRVVDANADGRRDILAMSANATARQVTFWRSRDAQASSFDERPLLSATTTSSYSPVRFTVADVAGSTASDVVVLFDDATAANRDVVSYLAGRADGAFDAPLEIAALDAPADVAAANIAGTARAEVAAVSRGTGPSVVVYEASSSGVGFDARVIDATTASCKEVALGDLDGDTDIDIVAACGASGLRLYRNPGSLTTAWPMVALGIVASGNYDRVLVHDLDGDGRLEAVASLLSGDIEVVAVDASGAVASRRTIDPGVSALVAPAMAIGDFDRDGDEDLVVAGTTEIRWVQCMQAQRNRYISLRLSGNRNSTQSLATGDLDSDGILDVAAAIQNDQDVVWWSTGGTPWWNH